MKKLFISSILLGTMLLTSICASAQTLGTTGWRYLNSNWYYLVNDEKAHDQFVTKDNKDYYLDSNGLLKTGWFQANNSWYFSLDNGEIFKNNWKLYNGLWYYLGSDGKMLTGTQATINGTTYNFALDGHWIA
jgi:D-alanyl-D-alanine carboxypeptidase